MAEMVMVRKKDLIKVIEKADETVHWGSSSWKARKRLVEAMGGMEECYRCVTGSFLGAPGDALTCPSCAHALTAIRVLTAADYNTDYCRVPACGCPGDKSHP